MPATKSNAPASSYLPLIALAVLASVVIGAALGLPGAVAAYLALWVYSFVEPAPEFTGPKAPRGKANLPADERELAKQDSFAAVRRLRRTLVPGKHWVPAKDLPASWLGALWAGAVAAWLPAQSPVLRVAAALAGFAAVNGWAQARRAALNTPGVTWGGLVRVWSVKQSWRVVVGVVAGGALGAIAGALAGKTLAERGVGLGMPAMWFVLGCLALGSLGGAGIATTALWRGPVLADWKRWREVRGVWLDRWRVLKIDPVPACVSTRQVGEAEATVFDMGQVGSKAAFALGPKIVPMVGSGYAVTVLPVPNETKDGPVPGTVHPSKVEVVSWPQTDWPDVTDPKVESERLELAVRVVLMDTATVQTLEPILETAVEQVHDDSSEKAVWAVSLAWAAGSHAAYFRERGGSGAGLTGGRLGEALLDHRANEGDGVLFVGAIDEARYDDALEKRFADLSKEDRWNGIWTAVLKLGVPLPVVQHVSSPVNPVLGRAHVERTVFAARPGFDPREYATPGTERKLATALGGAAFVTVTSWTVATSRAGGRHAQAFSVYHSQNPIPARPDDVPGQVGDAPKMVLSGLINQAFDACKMARPEVVSVRSLGPEALRAGQKNLWEVQLRLYGGVSFGDVRTMGGRLRQAMGSAWLRVADAADGCTIFVGGEPKAVALNDPGRDTERLARLNWDQAWTDAKVLGMENRAPKLVAFDKLPANAKVQVLDFELVPGLDLADVRKGLPKLRTSTGNEYLDVRQGPDGPRTVRMLACETDPMPTLASFDYERARNSKRGVWPFGASIDGSPMQWNVADDPHMLVVGSSGTGKSITVQTLLSALAIKPASETQFFIVDAQKMGADYRFMAHHLSGAAWTVREGAALMKAVYNLGRERLARNAEYGVGNVKDWPGGPPPQLVLVIDEFASLIVTEQVSKQTLDDPELERSRQKLLVENADRITIGQYAGKIGRELRAAGVTMIMATQELKQDSMSAIPGGKGLKGQMSRMLLGKTSFGDRQSALRSPTEAADLGEVVPRGRGLFESSMHNALAFQTWYEPDLGKLTAAIDAAREPVSQTIDLTPYLSVEVAEGPAVMSVSFDEAMGLDDVEIIDQEDLDLSDLWGELEPEPEPEPEPFGLGDDDEVPLIDEVVEVEVPELSVPWGDLSNLWRDPEPAPEPLEEEFPEPRRRRATPTSVNPDWFSDEF